MDLSREDIKKLGERIAKSTGDISDSDLDMLQEYRRSFKEPLSEIFDTLRKLAIQIDTQSIVTYRIKRINTIIRKLRRFSTNPNGRMSLINIGDIAGCRCILRADNEDRIYKLLKLLIKQYGSSVTGYDSHDYIKNPKQDGYRSLHLYVKDPKSRRKIEIQIRNSKQHNWATLVEIVDLIFKTKIKEGEKNDKLRRFLYLFSKKEDLSRIEKEELVEIEEKYKIHRRMCDIFGNNYIRVRKQWISNERRGYYFVIEAGRNLNSTIEAYVDYDTAENSYYDKYVQNRDSNIVLVYVKKATFEQISKAYSNYMLTMHSFFDDYKIILEEQVLNGLKGEHLFKLWKSLKLYRKNTIMHLDTFHMEMRELEKCTVDASIKKKHKEEWLKNLNNEINKWEKGTLVFVKKQTKEIKEHSLYVLIIRWNFYLLRRHLNII